MVPPTLPPIASFDDPKLEALIEAMYLAATADGEFSAEEREQFDRNVETLTDRRLTGLALADVIERIEGALAKDGRDSRLAAVRERLEAGKQRKVALYLALQIMTADGILRTTERELILDLADALEIDPNDAAAMVGDAARAAGI